MKTENDFRLINNKENWGDYAFEFLPFICRQLKIYKTISIITKSYERYYNLILSLTNSEKQFNYWTKLSWYNNNWDQNSTVPMTTICNALNHSLLGELLFSFVYARKASVLTKFFIYIVDVFTTTWIQLNSK